MIERLQVQFLTESLLCSCQKVFSDDWGNDNNPESALSKESAM
jgi:hypothetical protein